MVYQIDPPSTHLVDLPIRFFYQNQYLRVQTPCAQDIVAAMEVHWSPNGWGWNDPVKQEFDLRDVLFVIFLENPIDDLWRLLVGTQTPPRFSRCFIWLFFYTPLQIHSTGASQVCMYIYICVYYTFATNKLKSTKSNSIWNGHQDLWENLCNSNALWPFND